MKNVLIVVLIVVVIALGFLLYKNRSAGAGLKPPKMARTSGATHIRNDKNGKNVSTKDCDILIGQNNDICVIPISYLRKMMQPGQDDYALEVHHKDTIIWYGDGGESLDVQPIGGADCPGLSDAPQSGTNLTDTISSPGVLQFSQVPDDKGRDNYCYKTKVNVTVNGKTTPLDPHMFNDGP